MTEPGITPQQIVGANMRELREMRGWTQEALGRALKDYLGKRWARQGVSAAEAGHREFTAVELYALAGVLGTTVEVLLAIRDVGAEVVFPSGRTRRGWDFVGAPLLGPESNRAIVADLNHGLSGVARNLEQLAERVQFIQQRVEEGEQYVARQHERRERIEVSDQQSDATLTLVELGLIEDEKRPPEERSIPPEEAARLRSLIQESKRRGRPAQKRKE